MSIEVMYNSDLLPKCDMFGVVVYETQLTGIINNFPLRRRAVPFQGIDIYKANDRQLRFYARDEDLNIVNLTGATCTFSVKENKSSTSFAIQKSTTVAAEGMIGSADEGEAFFFLLPADTSGLDEGQYWFDVKVVLSDGKAYTTVEGHLNLLSAIN